MLKARVLTAILLLAGLLSALFLLPAAGWLLVCALVCGGAAWEWSGLAGLGRGPGFVLAAVFAALCLGLGAAAGLGSEAAVAPALLLPVYAAGALFWVLAVPAWLQRKWRLGQPLLAVAVGLVVLLPPALALAHLRTYGPWVLLSIMAVVWIADIAAYFSGRAFGRRKLAPSISPGKTWEGAFGAAAGVLVFGLAVAVYADVSPPGGLVPIVPLLLFWTAMSIVGDLFESLLKRQAGVKDSGALLPGHGGILDRIDSLTSTLPLAALAMILLAP